MARIRSAGLLFIFGILSTGCNDQGPNGKDRAADTASNRGSDAETGADAGLDTNEDTGRDAATDKDTGTGLAYDNLGVCGMEGEAVVTGDSFDGYEDHYIIGDEGLGDDTCRVRYEMRSVGVPDVPCELCTWAFVVEKSNPTVVTDVDGSCANSELGLDETAIFSMDGQLVAYGYVPEYVGHSNVLMRYNENVGAWEAVTFAAWDETSQELYYDRRDGYCGY